MSSRTLLFGAAAGVLGIWFLISGGASQTIGWWHDRQISAHIEECEKEGPRKQQCFEEIIVTTAHTEGIAPAFDVVAKLYDRDRRFADSCHGNTHELGAIAYEAYKQSKDFTVSPKMSYCGFGFYHGFLEAMFFDNGTIKGAERFCDWLDAKFGEEIQGVSYACYHGIGHGVTDGSDPTHWGSVSKFVEPGLTLCRALTDTGEHRERCASGVFNALALAYMDPKYGLSNDARDPYAFCRTQKEDYIKRECYDQMNTYIMWTHPEFADALSVAMTRSEPGFRTVAVTSVVGPQAQRALIEHKDLVALITTCSTLPSRLADLCAHGFATALIEFGKPGEEYKIADAVCARAGDRAPACFNAVARNVVDRLPPASHEQVCDDIERLTSTAMAEDCRNIIRGGEGLLFE